MPAPFYLYNASKSIPLEAFPDDAWQSLSGNDALPGELSKYWEVVGWLYRCIHIRANALLRVPWALTTKGGGEIWSSSDSKPLPAVYAYLAQLRGLFNLTEMALILTGEAFWHKERNRVRLLNLRWLAPQTMIPIWDETGLTKFERRINGKKMDMPVGDVIYFALPNPLHETKPGPSPAGAALADAGVLYNVDAFASAFFERGAIKATLLTVEGNPPKAELERLESWWKRFFAGNQKAYQSAAIRAGVTPVVVGEGIEGLANQTLTTEKRQGIATALGIPHSLVFSDAANYATAQQDELNFLEYTVLPSAHLIEETVNRQLLDPLGLAITFQPETMDAFQADETSRSQSLVHLRSAGMPMETALAVLGYEIPEGLPIEEEIEPLPEEAQPSQNGNERQPGSNGANGGSEQADMKRWERKALRNLAAGKGADVPFDSEHIPPERAEQISLGLSRATTPALVSAAFKLQVIPDVAEEPLPPVPPIVAINESDIQRALSQWDAIFPDFAGLLDAEVFNG